MSKALQRLPRRVSGSTLATAPPPHIPSAHPHPSDANAAGYGLYRTAPLFDADAAPGPHPFSWTDGQFDFDYLGVDGDILKEEPACSNDGLNKLLNSHLGYFFYDPLCVNVIIVAFSMLPIACLVLRFYDTTEEPNNSTVTEIWW